MNSRNMVTKWNKTQKSFLKEKVYTVQDSSSVLSFKNCFWKHNLHRSWWIVREEK